MLRAIGEHKPKRFAILDLSKSYYQFALSESSKHYTAFITAKALYEWNRVPMGLKGAGAYVQRTMQTLVLAGLVHTICEVFMDDILIWGNSDEEFLANLRRVLERMRQFRLTCNPKKCKVGLTEVEYVGHVIDSTGTTFHRDRLQQIIDFPTPETKGELKSFLGMLNYMRDNIPDASEAPGQLNELLKGYKKSMNRHKIHWTPETTAAFQAAKDGINRLEKLFFLNTDMATLVKLYTDASDYCIGAHLTQIVDGAEQTIALMSHRMTNTQKEYSVREKECLAIVTAFEKFAYLIQHVHFTLFTDHKNLIHIRDTGSSRVLRWKMQIQAFSFTAGFIEGVKNVVADFMSRNPKATMLPEPEADYKATNLDTMILDGDTRIQPEEPEEPEEELSVFEEDLLTNRFLAMSTSAGIRPTQAQREILQTCHNEIVGHNGVEPMMRRLTENGHRWRYMRMMVKQFIQECDTCQKGNTKKRPGGHAVEPFTLSGVSLMSDLSVDFVGPFPEDEDGYQYLCVIIDTFSRWVELYPTRTNNALAAAESLMKGFGRFGAPKSLRSDGGAAFVNKLIEEFLGLVQTKHELTVADSHQENGMVESANREVRRYLKDIFYDRRLAPKSWAANVPLAQRIQNGMVKEMTGMKPCDILYAGSINLDAGLIPQTAQADAPKYAQMDKSWEDWLKERQIFQQRALEKAKEGITAHATAHQRKDNGARTEFARGTWVLKRYTPSAFNKGKPNKHVLEHTGPFQVESYKGQTYILHDPMTGRTMAPCNVHLLSEFEYDPAITNPADVRLKDRQDVYNVEKIVRHTGSWQKKKSLKFTVRWENCTAAEDTLETWANLSHNEALHKYMQENGVSHLIPKAHK